MENNSQQPFKRKWPGPVDNSRLKKKLFVAFPWVETSTGPGGFIICVFII